MESFSVLYVFDFDDTLVTCDSRVKIKTKDGDIKFLSAIEFSDYIYGGWPEGDEIDHSQFWEYPPNGRWITWAKNRLDYALESNSLIYLITGRERLDPIENWIKDNGVNSEKISFYSTMAQPKKEKYKEVIRKAKNKYGIKSVVIYEDSQEALDDMLEVCKEEGIKYSGYKMSKSIIRAEDPELVNYVCVEMV